MNTVRIKELRIKNNKTQEDIAKILDISASGYGFIENGKREANYASLIRLADYYEVSIDYLLGRDFEYKNTDITDKMIENRALQLLEEMMNKIKHKDLD